MFHIRKLVKTRLFKTAIIVVSVFFILYAGLSIVGAILIMNIPRVPVDGSPVLVGLSFSDVYFPARGDKINLRGWFLPGHGENALLIIHGGFQNRLDYEVGTLELTRDLVGRGYNVLLFDLRGRGESEGKGLSLLNIESDIGGAVDYLHSIGFPTEKIGIIGFCSGAGSAAIFAGKENVGALALDGCFAFVRVMVTRQAAKYNIHKFLLDFFYPGLSITVRLFYGYETFDPITAISDVTCPVFFIHEEYDNLTTLQETYELLEMSNNTESQMWEVSGVEHTQAYKTYPKQYIDKLDDFFTTRLKNSLGK